MSLGARSKEVKKLYPGFSFGQIDAGWGFCLGQDMTAAGDAFNAGLAVAIARGDDLPTAVRVGCAFGTLVVTQFGAQPSLPTRSEVESFLLGQNE